MATITADEVGNALGRVADGERIVVEAADGRKVALVPVADLELLERLEDEADVRAANAAREEMARTGEKPSRSARSWAWPELSWPLATRSPSRASSKARARGALGGRKAARRRRDPPAR
jgi:hypothetical protein